LINTYAGLILPGVASAFGTFLLRQHFMSLPSEVFEAAEVDGCGHLRRLFSFTLPMSIPAVATVALVAVIDEWNNFVWPLIITNSVDMRTLPIGLMYLKANDGVTNWGVLMSGTLIVVLPMLLVFLCAQRYIVSGLTERPPAAAAEPRPVPPRRAMTSLRDSKRASQRPARSRTTRRQLLGAGLLAAGTPLLGGCFGLGDTEGLVLDQPGGMTPD